MTRRLWTLFTGVVLLAVLITLAYVAPVRYVELVPGPTFNTLGTSGGTSVITISGARTSSSAGQLRMLTVGEGDNIEAYNVARGWFDHSTAVLRREVLMPPGGPQDQLKH